MKFVVIGDSDAEKNTSNEKEDITEYINAKKKVFLMIYSNGCPPCEAAKPEWDKLEERKISGDIMIARIASGLFDETMNAGAEPSGVPTFRYIHGKDVEEFTDGRETPDFEKWIKSKTSQHGGKTSQHGGRRRWSLKYKRSINCRRPRGFSQKQYCKRMKRHGKYKATRKNIKI